MAVPSKRRSRSLELFYYRLVTPLIRAFWALLRFIPDRSVCGAGWLIGRIILFGRRGRVIRNMRMVLQGPGCLVSDWDSLWHHHANHLGAAIAEILHYSNASADEVRGRAAIESDALLREALAGGRGAVVFMNHFSNPAVVPVAIALGGHPVSVATNVIPVPFLETALDEVLAQYGVSRVAVGGAIVSAAKKTLRANGVFIAAIDYSSTRSHTGWTPFGNAELQVSLVPAMIALMSGSAMFSAIVTRIGESRYTVSLQRISAPEMGSMRDRALASTEAAMRGVSDAVVERPEQWWRWDFPRIRTVPRESRMPTGDEAAPESSRATVKSL